MRRLVLTTTRKLAAVSIAGVTILGGSAAVWAATPGPGTTAGTAPAAATNHHHHHHGRRRHHRPVLAALRGADHATVEVKRSGNWVTLDLDRGKVSSYSGGKLAGGKLTVIRPDGKTVDLTVTSSTVFEGRSTGNLTGDRVAVVSSPTGRAEVVVLHEPRSATTTPAAG